MASGGLTKQPIGVNEHDHVFERVLVDVDILGGSVVSWKIDRRYMKFNTTPQFYLEWAESPTATFIQVAGPTAGNVLVDSARRIYSKTKHSVYRVKLVVDTNMYYSSYVEGTGNLNRHDYLLAKEIVRREFMLLNRYVGSQGKLLIRKTWGTECTNCIDFGTGEPTNSNCTVCYGTGFVGGYYPAMPLLLELAPREHKETVVEPRGTIADRSIYAKGVACPYLTSRDVWVAPETGERWFIQGKKEMASVRGKPLVWMVELKLIEPDNSVYNVPLTDESSSS